MGQRLSRVGLVDRGDRLMASSSARPAGSGARGGAEAERRRRRRLDTRRDLLGKVDGTRTLDLTDLRSAVRPTTTKSGHDAPSLLTRCPGVLR